VEGETVEWLWGLMQQDLAELHPGVRHITAEAGHSIQWERPDVVVDAIRDVVRATEERPG
jgi:pimeloyl-ACP methyl ester carboxylesterase